jgi:hypothetical protein
MWLNLDPITARVSWVALMPHVRFAGLTTKKRNKQRTRHQKKDTSSLLPSTKLSSNNRTHHIYPLPPFMFLPSHNNLRCGSEQCVQTTTTPTANGQQKWREARSANLTQKLGSWTDFSFWQKILDTTLFLIVWDSLSYTFFTSFVYIGRSFVT